MAAKYMGAKRLAKEKAKQKAADEAKKGAKGTIHANAGDYIDRKKQKFSHSSMQVDGDFEIE